MRLVPSLLLLALLPASAHAAPADRPTREAPRIVSVKLADQAVAGVPSLLVVRVRDPLAAVNGVIVDFGDGRARFAESACRAGGFEGAAAGPFKPGQTVEFTVPHRYTKAGTYDIELAAVSGDCVIRPMVSRQKLRVRVRGLAAIELPKRPVAVAAAAGCDGADVEPTGATLVLARTATLCLVNAVRASRSLRPLRSNRRLRTAAARHARDMVARNYFAHESPSGATLIDRLRKARYRPVAAGENIAAGTDELATPLATILSWIESPPHRANLYSSKFTEAGLGVATGFPTEPSAGATYVLALGSR